MDYKFRALTGDDVFSLADIISKIGVSEIMEATMTAKENDPVVGAKMIGLILGNLKNCKTEIFDFLSTLTGIDKKMLKNLKATEFTKMLKTLLTSEDFSDFFKEALELLA